MAAVAKHYVDEWERHPDLFVYPPTCSYPALAAIRVAVMASKRFKFPRPRVHRNHRLLRGRCVGTLAAEGAPCEISLSREFSVGEVLHELAHAWCFYRYGDHDHGSLFRAAMDDLCFWFRLEEKAQAAFFP